MKNILPCFLERSRRVSLTLQNSLITSELFTLPKFKGGKTGSSVNQQRIVLNALTLPRNADFTTGVGVTYEDEPLTIYNDRLPKFGVQPIKGLKLRAGERLLPALCVIYCDSILYLLLTLSISVTRCINSKPVRLIHEVQFDAPGGFRLYVLAGDLSKTRPTLLKFSTYLKQPSSFVNRFNVPLPRNAKRVLSEAMNSGITGFE